VSSTKITKSLKFINLIGIES